MCLLLTLSKDVACTRDWLMKNSTKRSTGEALSRALFSYSGKLVHVCNSKKSFKEEFGKTLVVQFCPKIPSRNYLAWHNPFTTSTHTSQVKHAVNKHGGNEILQVKVVFAVLPITSRHWAISS